jgi:hypothetical protein
VRLEIEHATQHAPPGGGTIVRGPWVATATPAPPGGSTASLEQLVSGYFAGARVAWRARIASTSPIVPRTPWRTASSGARGELELRTDASSPSDAPLPAAPPAHVSGISIGACRPHPARGAATIELALQREGRVRVDLFDVRGRRVRLVHDGLLAAGVHALALDVSAAGGIPLPAGVYFVRAAIGGDSASRRIVVVR